ncbi:hypothetical protein TWF106_006447 [Orbilia oligospora]|uniref:Uncharacterized protein n=1 Tax=Orbilia oligospora TaxID=2813651 RepID=A0A7C8V3L5_ORBOL|nr:hypothetical protein TWF106_006447 [Orbilia oligospora]
MPYSFSENNPVIVFPLNVPANGEAPSDPPQAALALQLTGNLEINTTILPPGAAYSVTTLVFGPSGCPNSEDLMDTLRSLTVTTILHETTVLPPDSILAQYPYPRLATMLTDVNAKMVLAIPPSSTRQMQLEEAPRSPLQTSPALALEGEPQLPTPPMVIEGITPRERTLRSMRPGLTPTSSPRTSPALVLGEESESATSLLPIEAMRPRAKSSRSSKHKKNSKQTSRPSGLRKEVMKRSRGASTSPGYASGDCIIVLSPSKIEKKEPI